MRERPFPSGPHLRWTLPTNGRRSGPRPLSREKTMSTESSAAIRETRRDWITEHREMYLRSGGVEGHIMDITVVGGHAFTTHCLIKYRGRKSGKTFITPLIYGDI